MRKVGIKVLAIAASISVLVGNGGHDLRLHRREVEDDRAAPVGRPARDRCRSVAVSPRSIRGEGRGVRGQCAASAVSAAASR
jgi:hypothetical protein